MKDLQSDNSLSSNLCYSRLAETEKIPLKITCTNEVTRMFCLLFTQRDIVQLFIVFTKANGESKKGGGCERQNI